MESPRNYLSAISPNAIWSKFVWAKSSAPKPIVATANQKVVENRSAVAATFQTGLEIKNRTISFPRLKSKLEPQLLYILRHCGCRRYQ